MGNNLVVKYFGGYVFKHHFCQSCGLPELVHSSL